MYLFLVRCRTDLLLPLLSYELLKPSFKSHQILKIKKLSQWFSTTIFFSFFFFFALATTCNFKMLCKITVLAFYSNFIVADPDCPLTAIPASVADSALRRMHFINRQKVPADDCQTPHTPELRLLILCKNGAMITATTGRGVEPSAPLLSERWHPFDWLMFAFKGKANRSFKATLLTSVQARRRRRCPHWDHVSAVHGGRGKTLTHLSMNVWGSENT